jgi:methionyl-tRNA synthetase
LTEIDRTFLKESFSIINKYVEAMDAVKIKEGLSIAMELSSHCNKFI